KSFHRASKNRARVLSSMAVIPKNRLTRSESPRFFRAGTGAEDAVFTVRGRALIDPRGTTSGCGPSWHDPASLAPLRWARAQAVDRCERRVETLGSARWCA